MYQLSIASDKPPLNFVTSKTHILFLILHISNLGWAQKGSASLLLGLLCVCSQLQIGREGLLQEVGWLSTGVPQFSGMYLSPPARQPGLVHDGSILGQQESTQEPLSPGPEMAHCSFYYILLAKASHWASPGSRGEDTESIS